MIPHWIPHWIPDDLTRWQICLQGCGLSVCWSSSVFCTAKKMLWNAAKTVDFLNPRFTPPIQASPVPGLHSAWLPTLVVLTQRWVQLPRTPRRSQLAGSLWSWISAPLHPRFQAISAHFGPCQVVWESLWISCSFKRPSFLLCSPAHSRKKSWKDQKELHKISQKPISCLWW